MNRNQKKLKKKKRREERLRQRKHEQRAMPAASETHDEDGGYDEDVSESMPSPFGMERSLRAMAKAAVGKEFANIEEYNAHMRPVWNELSAVARALPESDPKEHAQELAFQAMEASNASAARELVRQALEVDPDCVDALTLEVQLNTGSADEQIAALDHVVETGARTLGGPAFFEQNTGHFWGLVLTRPYMRARQDLAHRLTAQRRIPEAAAHYAALLKLNSSDNQGNRWYFLGCLLHQGSLDQARALIDENKDDAFGFFNWGRVLERFLSGDRIGAVKRLHVARSQNPYVADMLLGSGTLSPIGEYYQPGKRSEAVQVALSQGFAWTEHAAALDWLREGGKATSRLERERNLASYGAPVSNLLTLGRPEREDRDDLTLGLSEKDIPELIRMAGDACLREAEDDDHYYAAIHAWRALGQLRAEAAVGTLVEQFQAYEGSDWNLEELPKCLAQIGPAALQPLEAFLADATHSLYPRVGASDAIKQIAIKHGESRHTCVRILVERLARFEKNEPDFNGFLIADLMDLHAREALPVITQAFEADCVDESIAGDLDVVREDLESA
jgi:tetratricopeptide (TPR) repeat protein